MVDAGSTVWQQRAGESKYEVRVAHRHSVSSARINIVADGRAVDLAREEVEKLSTIRAVEREREKKGRVMASPG